MNCTAQTKSDKTALIKGTKKSITKTYTPVIDELTIYRKDINTYDENGNRVQLVTFRSDSSQYYKYTYEYDSNNNLILLLSYNIKGEVLQRTEIKYDKKNRKIETISWQEGGFSNRYYRKYENDKLVKRTMINESGAEETVYEYDSKGRINSEITYLDGKLTRKVLKKYEDYD